jgi:multidrug efflux pump subunit AcrA (membrane-fusion protein)
LGLSVAVVGGLWFALPQTRPLLTGYASHGWPVVRTTLASLSARFSGEPALAASDKVRGVRAMRVRLVEQRSEKRFTGVVAARYETQVGFRVAGKIAARQVEVGQAVRRGDVLMTLDEADLAAALRAAEANLAATIAQKAQALAEEARQLRLLDQGWTTRAALD